MTKPTEEAKAPAPAAAAKPAKPSPRETTDELIRLAEGAAQECRSRSMRRCENFFTAFVKAMKNYGA